jgi:hypothetical protein
LAVLSGCFVLGVGAAAAQAPDPNFDANMAAMLGRAQQQNNAGIQQLWQTYLQQNGPRLMAEYRQLVANGQAVGTFEQYAYWSLMTANGTDLNTWRQQSEQNFQRLQQGHQTVQQGNDDYNQGWQRNTERQTQAVENNTNQTIRGNAPYENPDGGDPIWLPNNAPPRQPFNWGGNIYVRDENGNYYRQQGNDWLPLDPH